MVTRLSFRGMMSRFKALYSRLDPFVLKNRAQLTELPSRHSKEPLELTRGRTSYDPTNFGLFAG